MLPRNWLECQPTSLRTIQTFNKCVKIGNWFEERALEEEMLKEYLYKRDNNLLEWQKNQKVNDIFLNMVEISHSAAGYVKYGDKVMILNTPILNSCTEVKPLCVHVPYELLHSHNVSLDFIDTPVRDVSASNFVYAPTKISTFVIRGQTGANDDEIIRYGEPFLIYNYSEKLLLRSMKQDPLITASTQSGSNVVALVDQCDYNCLFKAIPFKEHLCLELDGEPVKANMRLIINHIATNQNLSLEDGMLRSVFGSVNEVSCNTKRDSHRNFAHKNHWCFFMDGPRRHNFPITLMPFI